jgi:hypothetical protein
MYIANDHVRSVKCRTSVLTIHVNNFRTSEIIRCFRGTIPIIRTLLTVLKKTTVTTKVAITNQLSISWSSTTQMIILKIYIICIWSVVLSLTSFGGRQ